MRMAKLWVIVLLMPFVSMAGSAMDCKTPSCGNAAVQGLDLSGPSSDAFHRNHKRLDHLKAMLVEAGLDEDMASKAIEAKKDEWVAKKKEKLLAILEKVGVEKAKAEEVVDKLHEIIKEKRDMHRGQVMDRIRPNGDDTDKTDENGDTKTMNGDDSNKNGEKSNDGDKAVGEIPAMPETPAVSDETPAVADETPAVAETEKSENGE